jgi:hypothetical protein
VREIGRYQSRAGVHAEERMVSVIQNGWNTYVGPACRQQPNVPHAFVFEVKITRGPCDRCTDLLIPAITAAEQAAKSRYGACVKSVKLRVTGPGAYGAHGYSDPARPDLVNTPGSPVAGFYQIQKLLDAGQEVDVLTLQDVTTSGAANSPALSPEQKAYIRAINANLKRFLNAYKSGFRL